VVEQHVAGNVIFKFPPIPQSRGFNELPYRMLTPEGLDNLLVAGRCASMTHDGQSAARVSGACFAMGEAAGTAAALALSGNTIPRDIAMEKLRHALNSRVHLSGGIRACRWGSETRRRSKLDDRICAAGFGRSACDDGDRRRAGG
jgi:FAD dependent oxidoreductase